MPAELYWHDATLTKLNDDFAADLCRLFTEGVQAASCNRTSAIKVPLLCKSSCCVLDKLAMLIEVETSPWDSSGSIVLSWASKETGCT